MVYSSTELTEDDELGRLANTAASSLGKAFGLPFVLWAFEEEWTIVFCEMDQDHGGWPHVMMPRNPPEMLLAGNIWAAHVNEGQHRLEIPILQRNGHFLVATLTAKSTDHELLIRLAQSCQRELAAQLEVEQCQAQLNALCSQASDDLEEISLLREIAGQLEMSDTSVSSTEMAQIVFPILRQSIKAESIVMLMDSPDQPPLAVGQETFDQATCWKLVEQYGHAASDKPVVRNHFDADVAVNDFPDIRDFILLPIAKAGQHHGWMLALNRVIPPGFNPRRPRPFLSQFEFGTCEAGLLGAVAALLATHDRNIQLFREKESLLTNAVRTLVSVIEAKDAYTSGHSERVALFGRRLGQEIGLNEDQCEALYLTGLLHDVGKIGVPDETLHKSSSLSAEEFQAVKRHPELGGAILRDLEQLSYVLPGVVHHHERFDGRGYPDGLAGEEIPLAGRILAVADAYDAMTSDRPYRNGMEQNKALAILNDGAGTQWDPRLVDAFLRVMPDIVEIRNTYECELEARSSNGFPANPFAELANEVSN